jgi:hypothetical protein
LDQRDASLPVLLDHPEHLVTGAVVAQFAGHSRKLKSVFDFYMA